MKIFVYGTLMSGEPNHRQLRGAPLVGPCRTVPGYALVSLGPYPALLDRGVTSVAGEIYEIDDVTLLAVDRFEGVPTLYRRAPIVLTIGDSVEGYLLARCGGKRYEPIHSGDWRVHQCESKS